MYTYQEIFYNEIRKKIVSGELKVGEKLPTLRELSEKYHLGKTTIHSGIVELERAGFVVVEPRVGVFVNDYRKNGNIFTLEMLMGSRLDLIDNGTLNSMLRIKKDIEPSVIKSAAENRTDKDVEYLFNIYQEILNEKNVDEYSKLKFKLYQFIWSCADNELYVWMFNSFQPITVNIYKAVYNIIGINNYDAKLG
jgi:DNA-binding FadR family transcriptional regulator